VAGRPARLAAEPGRVPQLNLRRTRVAVVVPPVAGQLAAAVRAERHGHHRRAVVRADRFRAAALAPRPDVGPDGELHVRLLRRQEFEGAHHLKQPGAHVAGAALGGALVEGVAGGDNLGLAPRLRLGLLRARLGVRALGLPTARALGRVPLPAHQHQRDQHHAGERGGEPGHGRVAGGPLPHALHLGHPPGGDRLAGEEVAQVVGQCLRAGVAAGGVLLKTAEAHDRQVARDAAGVGRGRHRLGAADLVEGVELGDGGERRAAGEEEVQHRPERVHVHAGADGGGRVELLGGHVVGGAEERAGLRETGAAVEVLGEAEVGDQRHGGGTLALAEQHVDRLQVAVDDAAGVGGVHRPRQLLDDRGGVAGRERGAAGALGEGAAGDVLHRVERQPIVPADLVHRHDVLVPQAGARLRFRQEADHLLGRRVPAGEGHLQRDRPVQLGLPGEVHDAHAAAADLALDLVTGDDRQVGVRRHRLMRLRHGERQQVAQTGQPGPRHRWTFGAERHRERQRRGGGGGEVFERLDAERTAFEVEREGGLVGRREGVVEEPGEVVGGRAGGREGVKG